MNKETARTIVYWMSGTNIVAGLWLILAPYALGYSGVQPAFWNDIIVGLAVAVLAGTRVSKPLRNEGLSWTNLLLGVWLIIAPFVLGYSATAAAMWNDITLGVIVAALATSSGYASKSVPAELKQHAA